jgi:hypothetical protein
LSDFTFGVARSNNPASLCSQSMCVLTARFCPSESPLTNVRSCQFPT